MPSSPPIHKNPRSVIAMAFIILFCISSMQNVSIRSPLSSNKHTLSQLLPALACLSCDSINILLCKSQTNEWLPFILKTSFPLNIDFNWPLFFMITIEFVSESDTIMSVFAFFLTRQGCENRCSDVTLHFRDGFAVEYFCKHSIGATPTDTPLLC